MTFPLTEPTQVDGVAPDTVAADSTPTPTPAPATVQAEPAGSEFVVQLARLAELHRAGSLTDDEFSSAKSRVLQRPAARLTARRVTLPMPSRRMVPEIHPVGALTSVSVVLLDQVARRLGATCRPVSEMPVRIPLDGTGQATSDQPHAAGENDRPTARA